MNLGLYLADIKPIDGGVYQYSIYLLRMLLNCKQIDHITIFIRSQNENDFSDHFEKSRVTVIVCNESKVKDLLRQISDFWIARYYMREYPKKTFLAMHRFFNPDRKYFNSFDIDLLLVPKQHAPVYKLKYPVVITMHDLQHLHFPEFFSPLQRIQKSISYYISIEEADRIIVSYDHVKFDLEKYFCSAKEKINVCAVPIDNDWITRDAID
ncbi:MAG: glycosyltransferase, partial [Chloroflexota bacterium]